MIIKYEMKIKQIKVNDYMKWSTHKQMFLHVCKDLHIWGISADFLLCRNYQSWIFSHFLHQLIS